MIELTNFLKSVPKKEYSKDLIVAIAGYIKQRNYKRSDYKKISKKIMSDEEADEIFDSVDMTLTYDLIDIKKKLVKVKGEKLDVHDNYKYIEMKRHYQDRGLCKILYPSSYGFLLNGEYKQIDVDIYFGNVNYVEGKKIYNFGRIWSKDIDMKTYESIPTTEKINEPIIEINNEPIIDPIIETQDNISSVKSKEQSSLNETEKHKKMRERLNATMSSMFFLDD